MGVYIKGMEMPKSCNACMFDVYGLCLINKNIEGKDELTHSCPLVHVPDHGRLIDADALYDLLDNGFDLDFEEVPETKRELLRMIADAFTIIPAEEEIADLCTKGHLHLGYAEEGER